MISQLSSVVSLPQPPHAPLDFPSSFLTCAALLILSVQSTDSAVHRQVLRLGIPEMSENIILKNYTTPASAFYKLSVYSSPLLPLVCSSTFIVLPQIQLVKLHHFITHLSHRTKAFSSIMLHQAYYTQYYELSTMPCLLPVLTSNHFFSVSPISHLSILLYTLNSFKLP